MDIIDIEYNTSPFKWSLLYKTIHTIVNHSSCAFDTTCPYAILGKSDHTFEGCEELQDPATIKKAYI